LEVNRVELSSYVRNLLVPAQKLAPFVSDQYDVPLGSIVKHWSEEPTPRWGFIGIPFDTTTIVRRGSKFGPRAVRDALAGCTCYEPGLDVDLSALRGLVDFGDIDVLQTEIAETWERIDRVLSEIAGAGVVPLVIGGDHGNSFPVVRGMARALPGRIGVIMIDAHFDVRVSHHGEVSSGVPFRRMIEDLGGRVRGNNMVQIGINGWHASRYYADWCREQGIRVITAREVHQRRLEDVAAEALQLAGEGTDWIYFSIDIDGMDVYCAMGTNATNVGGLSSYQALELTYLIGRHPKIKGFDVMEVSPYYDTQAMTSNLAASLFLNFLAGQTSVISKEAAS
jgi:formimidoylglutamase